MTHLLLKGSEFKLGDIGVVIEIRRARSDRNSNNAAKFCAYPCSYFTFYLEEIFCTHSFPFFFIVIRYRYNLSFILSFIFLFCRYVALVIEDYELLLNIKLDSDSDVNEMCMAEPLTILIPTEICPMNFQFIYYFQNG